MSAKMNRKAEVLAAIAIVLFSALLAAGTTQALEPQKGTIDFVLLYKDVETNDSYYLSDVGAYLYDMNGALKGATNSSSNGIVEFNNVVYGNYVVRINSVKKGNYVYGSAYDIIHFDKNGVTRIANGADFTNITVNRYPLTHKLNITLEKNGLPATGKVVLSAHGCTFATDYVYGNATFNVTEGMVTIEVVYNDGGVEKDYYRYVDVSKTTKQANVTVNLDNYVRVLGTVRYAGKIVNTTTHVVILNKTTDDVWKILTFNGGSFSFYLPSLNYVLAITADGYSVETVQPSTSILDVKVVPVTNNVDVKAKLSDNLQWVNVTYVEEISNKSVIPSLPYSDAGILYYQMKLLGWDNSDLLNYLKSRYLTYTSHIITVDNNIYQLKGTVSFSPSSPTHVNLDTGFTVTLGASYYNGDVCKKELLSDGSVNVELYAHENVISGAHMKYTYDLYIPSYLERSNEVAGADVSGYVGDVAISNVKTSPVDIVLKERKSPEIRLDAEHFVVGWSHMSDVNHVVNQSADNYTIVVPTHEQVWFNASKMVYDVVLGKTDPANTTYTWKVDNVEKLSGKGKYNFTMEFTAAKKYMMTVRAEDVGGNVNETNITVIADGYWPTVNITLKNPEGKVIATFKTDAHSLARIDYNISGTLGHAWRNSTTYVVKVGTPLVINQSEEILFNAKASYDTFDGSNETGLPVIVVWNFNGNMSTGANRSYAFDMPTRHGPYYVNVTLKDSVNNTVIISFPVKVKDITKPVVKLNFTVAGKNVNEVKENQNVTLDATGSYDPQNGTIAKYVWTIKDSSYKVINITDGIYSVVNGSFEGNKVTLKFHKYGTYYIILNVTDACGNYNVINRTLRVTPVRPDLAINTVNIKGDRVEGATLTFEVNVSNNGNAVAKKYSVALYVNGKVVANKTFTDLKNGSYAIRTITWTPSAPGNYTVTVKVYCADEPSSYLSDNVKKETVKIEQAPWKLPAIIGGSIAIIIIAGYIAWRYMEKKNEKKKFKKGGSKKGSKSEKKE